MSTKKTDTVEKADKADVEAVLTDAEATALDECEETIRAGLTKFIEVGSALTKIRDERLYRTTYPTFEDYCREKWDLGRNYVNKIISATNVIGSLAPSTPKPVSERQARELNGLSKSEATAVMKRAAKISGKPQPTTKSIKDARAELFPPEPKAKPQKPVLQAVPDPEPSEPEEVTASTDDDPWADADIQTVEDDTEDGAWDSDSATDLPGEMAALISSLETAAQAAEEILSRDEISMSADHAAEWLQAIEMHAGELERLAELLRKVSE